MMLPLFEPLRNHRLGAAQISGGAICPLAQTKDRADISHRLSTAFRNLIAFFSYRVT
jgi:hypothetical protein